MNFNLTLLVKILLLETLYFVALYFILIFAFFLYFGSGSGASSSTAEVVSTVAITVITVIPIIFNSYKIVELKKVNAGDSYAYLISTVILILVFMWLFCLTDLVVS
jgi:amino acid transporter